MADATKHKSRVHQLDFIWEFLQAKVNNRVFKSWIIDIHINIQKMRSNLEEPWDYWSPCMAWLTLGSFLLMSIISMHRWIQNCCIILFGWLCLLVYKWSSCKWFKNTLGKIFHFNFLGYAHWFMSINIFQMKDHSISFDQDIYATSIFA